MVVHVVAIDSFNVVRSLVEVVKVHEVVPGFGKFVGLAHCTYCIYRYLLLASLHPLSVHSHRRSFVAITVCIGHFGNHWA
jgi:hypothetical protein